MLSNKTIEKIDGLKITVNDRNKTKEFDLGEIFNISEEDLSKEFVQQASLYAYFCALQSKAEFDASLIGLSKDQESAAADESFRKQLEREDKKYTEAVIRGMILSDEECAKLMESELEAKYDASLLKAICKALEMRANMLVSLGSHLRHELDQTGMSIRDNQLKQAIDNVKSITAKSRKEQV